jgi:hypothetical protein
MREKHVLQSEESLWSKTVSRIDTRA